MAIRLHTDRHYEAELKDLHVKILEMGGFVEKQIVNGIIHAGAEVSSDLSLKQIATRVHAQFCTKAHYVEPPCLLRWAHLNRKSATREEKKRRSMK